MGDGSQSVLGVARLVGERRPDFKNLVLKGGDFAMPIILIGDLKYRSSLNSLFPAGRTNLEDVWDTSDSCSPLRRTGEYDLMYLNICNDFLYDICVLQNNPNWPGLDLLGPK